MSVTYASRRVEALRQDSWSARTEPPDHPAGQAALPLDVRAPVPPAAAALLRQAKQGLAGLSGEAGPVPRFIASYLSALRAAAAIVAARGRPHRGRARPESVWTLLESAAPELAPWASFFAAHSARQAAAQAGVTRRITPELADDLQRSAGDFVALAARVVHARPPGRSGVRCGSRPRVRGSRGG